MNIEQLLQTIKRKTFERLHFVIVYYCGQLFCPRKRCNHFTFYILHFTFYNLHFTLQNYFFAFVVFGAGFFASFGFSVVGGVFGAAASSTSKTMLLFV